MLTRLVTPVVQLLLAALPTSIMLMGSLLSAPHVTAVTIPATPLQASQLVEPNINYVLDNSGSMMFEVMPEQNIYEWTYGYDVYGTPFTFSGYYLFKPTTTDYVYGYNSSFYSGNYTLNYRYLLPYPSSSNIHEVVLRSARGNTLFYNPAVTYKPWVTSTGGLFGLPAGSTSADPTAAKWNPSDSTAGSIDLTSRQTVDAYWYNYQGSFKPGLGSVFLGTYSYWPITYYVFKGGVLDPNVVTSYVRYQIRGNTAYRLDLAGGAEAVINGNMPNGRSVADERRNFANWFQYYRSRILAAKASTFSAFSELGPGYRVGLTTINASGYEISVPTSGNFGGAERDWFFSRLQQLPIYQQGTPLRTALASAGERYRKYWADSISCRRSFSILTTDGYWNDTFSGTGDADGDGRSNTLADVARYYWERDLVTLTKPAQLPPQRNMTTFGLSLGVRGSLDPDNPPAYNSTSWPDPNSGNIAKIDDLLHAAVNGGGRFIAAASPEEFRVGLVKALDEITQMAGSQSAGATSSELYSGNDLYYQTAFDSANWSGDVIAYKLVQSGNSIQPTATQAWNAASQLLNDSGRVILFGDGEQGKDGKPFLWSAASRVLQDKGLTESLVTYLRGNASGESSGLYRKRGTKLGDIIGSSPLYVGKPSAKLAASIQSRSDVVYVGANDGMLHALDARTGKEKFAYIPSWTISGMVPLAQPNYPNNHRYLVDGLLASAEAQNQSQNWGTYLAGSLGRGGAGMFLLNVSAPDSVTESATSAKAMVAWEFGGDSHLGLQHQMPPHIVKLNDGKHYVLAPNGYNSPNGSAALFILPISTAPGTWAEGSNYHRLVSATGPDNGLSAITPYDIDDNGTIDLVYAGDLKGNVWKFDLSNQQPANWKVGLGGKPLFQAMGPSNLPQPISAAPAVAPHPLYKPGSNGGLMVYVGTGRYVADCDRAGRGCTGEDGVQSVYGLWDYGGIICSRNELLRQQLSDYVLDNQSYRISSNEKLNYPPQGVVGDACPVSGGTPRSEVYQPGMPPTRYPFPSLALTQDQRAKQADYWLGWRMDLPVTGERVVSFLDYYRKRVEFQTYIPGTSTNVCSVDKDSGYIMRVNFANGGSFVKPRFDDDPINKALGNHDTKASGIVGKKTRGSLGRVKVKYRQRLVTFQSLTEGGTEKLPDEVIGRMVKRVSWREIITD